MTCLVRRVVIRELDLDACDLVVIKQILQLEFVILDGAYGSIDDVVCR